MDESRIYLQVEIKGYIKEFGTSKTLVDAETKFREFFGIGLIIDLFDSYNIDSLASILGSLIDRSIFVHRQSEGQWILEAKFQHDPDITRFLSRIKLAHSYESFKEDGDYFDWLRDKINTIKYCLSANAQSERVLRACRWVFDSFLGKNELLSFVQTMVALEILLGEKAESDLMGLGALLRNRCAYLIGKTQSEREKLLKEFNEIYKVRCDIVHQGKSRLSFNENIQFQRLRDICNRVINAEINLLISDLNHTQ